MIVNYKHKYATRGKWIFVPTEQCERKGRRIMNFFKKFKFPDHYYHYKKGGHVAALHAHVDNQWFFRIDIKNFYYSVARMRVTRALRSYAYQGANTVASWSCVRTPYAEGPAHVLPIGFVQSPLLASLVLMKSQVEAAIKRAIANGVVISVYMDDFIGSHDDKDVLTAAYEDIRRASVAAGLIPNPDKLVPPAEAIRAFNCELKNRSANVTAERIAKYYAQPNRSPMSDASFVQYVNMIAAENAPRL